MFYKLMIGKYDTYKGSTHRFIQVEIIVINGKYDTYKGSTQFTALQCIRFFSTREI